MSRLLRVAESPRAPRGRLVLAAIVPIMVALAACGASPPAPTANPAPTVGNVQTAPGPTTPPNTPSPQPTPKPTPKRTQTPKPKPKVTLTKAAAPGVDTGGAPPPTKPPSDGVPTTGSGTFTVAPGGTDVVGTGTTLVTYQVEVEDGIVWGSNPVWTADSFASAVDGVLADPHGWLASDAAPITDAAQKMADASWSFQRVVGATYSVRIRLATPDTVDKLCGSVGLTTEGVYSCRYGKNIVINLRRWLKGAPGFAMNLSGYHTMVINHEMGHLLGFKHMLCPGAGQLAPVMQEETIDLAGCLPNAYPFAPDGTFIDGPWAAS